MNTAHFIAKHIRKASKGSFSRIAMNLAITSISIGIAVLLIALSVLGGFKRVISDKIYNFDSHIQITQIPDYREAFPLKEENRHLKNILSQPEIKHVSKYVTQLGIIQYQNELEGVEIKGVGKDFSVAKFNRNLIEGRFIDFNNPNEVVVSQRLATKLNIAVNDTVLFNVLGEKRVKHEWLYVKGIYATGLEDIDNKKVIGNIRLTQKMHHWDSIYFEGLDLDIHNIDSLSNHFEKIENLCIRTLELEARSIENRYYAVFDWLEIISANVNFLFVIVFIIVFVNIFSIVLVIIMERSSMIGILKALGANNRLIGRSFYSLMMLVTTKSILIGNVIMLALYLIQTQTHFIPLDPETYYMSYVPMNWDWSSFVLINIGTVIVISLIVIFPVLIISSIRPIKAIKFE